MNKTEDPRLLQQADYLAQAMPRIGKSIMSLQQPARNSLTAKMTTGQMAVLFHLTEQGAATMRSLADEKRVTMPTMSEIVDRLVRLGLAERCPDPEDRRIVRIRITGRGRRAFRHEYEQARNLCLKMLQSLSSAEQVQLIQAFQKLEDLLVKPARPKPILL